MTRRQPVLAVITLLLLASLGWAAEGQDTQQGGQAPDQQAFADIRARTDGNPVLLEQPTLYSAYDGRIGWWAKWVNGSPAKTGEFQDLQPAPFFDFDGISSDGNRTFNFYATGTDKEDTNAGLTYYRGDFKANIDYERFIHRLDHDPLGNMADVSVGDQNIASADPKVMKQDLNVGKDYAVRVQELNASFKKNISDNLKVRLDLWGLQKDGTRQTNAVAKCYNGPTTTGGVFNWSNIPPDHLGPGGTDLGNVYSGRRCHVLSQQQQIDWITTEIKPVIECRLGESIAIEYSRPMRGFTAADETVGRFYNRTGILTYNSPSGSNDAPYNYAVVPDSYTQMDQVKISGNITENTRVYSYLMAGNTVNQEISMNRWFNNADMRITNTSIKNLTIIGYGKIFNEAEEMPDATLVKNLELPNQFNPTTTTLTLDHPINYHKTTAGAKGVWRPRGGGYSRDGLAIIGGYEYSDLNRAFAIYEAGSGEVNESNTITNSFQIGPDIRWSSRFDTFLRYKYQNAVQPLLFVQAENAIANTSLPQRDHIVELGFNWVPSDWFVFNASVGIEHGETHDVFGDAANRTSFDEENYPMSFTAWYAASNRLSLSAGYAIYSNFVAQDINVADNGSSAQGSGRWNYGGQAQVVTFGTRYIAAQRVTLSGQVEWVRGHNLITASPLQFSNSGDPTTNPDLNLGSLSEVLNETTRVSLGVDWVIYPRVVNYYRYELYNFLDKAPGYQTGTGQGILGGLSALF